MRNGIATEKHTACWGSAGAELTRADGTGQNLELLGPWGSVARKKSRAKGGETNPDNLTLLCRAHHWAVHDGGFRVNGRAPHGLVFRRPDGSHLPACPVRIPISGTAGETLREINRRVGLEITANTVDSFWDGEAVDYHMAVDGLLECEDHSKDEQGE